MSRRYPNAMRPTRTLFLLPFVLGLFSPSALAQQPKPQLLPQPTQPVVTATDAATLPPPPVVEDPDLKPLPPARLSVSSWDDISKYLRARSADLRIALDEVGRAQAQRRE